MTNPDLDSIEVSRAFQFAYQRCDLTLNRFAARYGVDIRTARRWAAGDAPLPSWVLVALNDLRLLQKEATT